MRWLFEEEEEELVIITRSQSYYILSYSDINIDALGNSEACSSVLNIPMTILNKCVECSKKCKEGD